MNPESQADGVDGVLRFELSGQTLEVGRKAGEVMPEMVRHCDIAVGNEEDADKVFGIKAPDVDVGAGRVEAEKFGAVPKG